MESRVKQPEASDYPAGLRALMGAQAPGLSLMGNDSLLARPAVGFCGSRHASEKGLAAAEDCADQAAWAGAVVVSGNASGVDRRAHRAALAAGQATILVLPEGIERFRVPRALSDVWDWDLVLVVSQFPANAVWRMRRAMARNQVIIGLSRAMVVIEAGETGGTWQAGQQTLQAGKPLFVAVYDGTHMSQEAVGNARLLEQGAYPLSRSRRTGRARLDRLTQVIRQPGDNAADPATPVQTALL